MKKKIINTDMYFAMKELLESYKEGTGLLLCPLCEAAVGGVFLNKCGRCAWTKFEGIKCTDWSTDEANSKWTIASLRATPWLPQYNDIRIKRIKMLKDWMSRSIVIPFWPF